MSDYVYWVTSAKDYSNFIDMLSRLGFYGRTNIHFSVVRGSVKLVDSWDLGPDQSLNQLIKEMMIENGRSIQSRAGKDFGKNGLNLFVTVFFSSSTISNRVTLKNYDLIELIQESDSVSKDRLVHWVELESSKILDWDEFTKQCEEETEPENKFENGVDFRSEDELAEYLDEIGFAFDDCSKFEKQCFKLDSWLRSTN